MEITLKRLTKQGVFANEVLFLTEEKSYSFGRMSSNDFVLFAPTIAKKHCIIHHKSKGLFVEVLKSLAGVVINGKKYSTGSMIRVVNNDLVEIGLLFKYKVESKIISKFDNFNSDFENESVKEEDYSDTNSNNDSIKMELAEESKPENFSQELNSAMQITIDDDDFKFNLSSSAEKSANESRILKIEEQKKSQVLRRTNRRIIKKNSDYEIIKRPKNISKRMTISEKKSRGRKLSEEKSVNRTKKTDFAKKIEISKEERKFKKEKSSREDKKLEFKALFQPYINLERYKKNKENEKMKKKSPRKRLMKKKVGFQQSITKWVKNPFAEDMIPGEMKEVKIFLERLKFVDSGSGKVLEPDKLLKKIENDSNVLKENNSPVKINFSVKFKSSNTPVKISNNSRDIMTRIPFVSLTDIRKMFLGKKIISDSEEIKNEPSVFLPKPSDFSEKKKKSNSAEKRRNATSEKKKSMSEFSRKRKLQTDVLKRNKRPRNSSLEREILPRFDDKVSSCLPDSFCEKEVIYVSSPEKEVIPASSPKEEDQFDSFFENEPLRDFSSEEVPGSVSEKEESEKIILLDFEDKTEEKRLPEMKHSFDSSFNKTFGLKVKRLSSVSSEKKLSSIDKSSVSSKNKSSIASRNKSIRLKNKSSISSENKSSIPLENKSFVSSKNKSISSKKKLSPNSKKQISSVSPVKNSILDFLKKKPDSPPEKKVSSDSSLKKVSSDSPLKKVSSDSSLNEISSDSSIKKVSFDSPLKKVSSDSSFKKVSSDSFLEKVSSDSPLKKVSSDSPLKKISSDSHINNFFSDSSLNEDFSDSFLNEVSLSEELIDILDVEVSSPLDVTGIFDDSEEEKDVSANLEELKDERLKRKLKRDRQKNGKIEESKEKKKKKKGTNNSGPPKQCPICKKWYIQLKRHSAIHSEEKPYTCTICDKGYSSQNYLNIHQLMHEKHKPYSCDICDKTFAAECQLKIHSTRHNFERPFTCDLCDKRFLTKADIRTHMEIHSGVRRQTCTICKKVLAHKNSLAQHMLIHSAKKNVKCSFCTMRFYRKMDLVLHMKKHENKKQFKCPHCEKRYNLSSVLNSHIKKAHTRQGLIKCKFCEKAFICRSECEDHQRIHTGEKPFPCSVCQNNFRSSKILKEHMRCHKPKFTCNECQEMFVDKFKLRRHLRIHFPKEAPICKVCGFEACRPSQLIDHLRVHTGERPFLCHFCDKRFGTNSTLRGHLMIHTGNYPYRCKQCGKGFERNYALAVHMKSHTAIKAKFSCSMCQMKFAKKEYLKRHCENHKTSVKRRCPVCDLGFRAEVKFELHQSMHSEVAGVYDCVMCSREFPNKEELVEHCKKTVEQLGKCSGK